MRKRGELCAQHLVRAQHRHVPFERVFGIELARLQIGDDVVMHMLEVAELLVEMPRQQQRGVVQVALGDLQRAFTELQGKIGRAERDRRHQRDAAQDQPLDRAHSAADQRICLRQQPARRERAVR